MAVEVTRSDGTAYDQRMTPAAAPIPSPGAPDRVDVAVIGAGIVGLATAIRLLEARPDLRLAVLEGEDRVAAHQSGHNSGVVHAGLYYAPGSQKALLCREGKGLLERYCEAHGIPIAFPGKLVVALDEAELPRLAALRARGVANGVTGSRRSARSGSARSSRTSPGSGRCGARGPGSPTSRS